MGMLQKYSFQLLFFSFISLILAQNVFNLPIQATKEPTKSQERTSSGGNSQSERSANENSLYFFIFLVGFFFFIGLVGTVAYSSRLEDIEVQSSYAEEAEIRIKKKLMEENLINNEEDFYIDGTDSKGKHMRFLVKKKLTENSSSNQDLEYRNSISLDLSKNISTTMFSETPARDFNFDSYKHRLDVSRKLTLDKQLKFKDKKAPQKKKGKTITKCDLHVQPSFTQKASYSNRSTADGEDSGLQLFKTSQQDDPLDHFSSPLKKRIRIYSADVESFNNLLNGSPENMSRIDDINDGKAPKKKAEFSLYQIIEETGSLHGSPKGANLQSFGPESTPKEILEKLKEQIPVLDLEGLGEQDEGNCWGVASCIDQVGDSEKQSLSDGGIFEGDLDIDNITNPSHGRKDPYKGSAELLATVKKTIFAE